MSPDRARGYMFSFLSGRMCCNTCAQFFIIRFDKEENDVSTDVKYYTLAQLTKDKN